MPKKQTMEMLVMVLLPVYHLHLPPISSLFPCIFCPQMAMLCDSMLSSPDLCCGNVAAPTPLQFLDRIGCSFWPSRPWQLLFDHGITWLRCWLVPFYTSFLGLFTHLWGSPHPMHGAEAVAAWLNPTGRSGEGTA
jgi:hypothetical protein